MPTASPRTRSSARGTSPKTTRPPARERRPPADEKKTARALGRKLDAVPDRIDIRDWLYRPSMAPLPDTLVNIARVPRILDQGTEGACTGYALAAVVNFLLATRGIDRAVSPRMLYEMARRYDEWPGEDYEGSSARGAMIGWVRHGVADEKAWPRDERRLARLGEFADRRRKITVADVARATPGGAYYRVMHRQVRDMHAALHETGALFCTTMVHDGWIAPGPATVDVEVAGARGRRRLALPVIRRSGRAESGHAVAIVGYTQDGFVVQNSWGTDWGARGFALFPYEDFLLHAADVWAAQLGVPVSVDLWNAPEAADTSAGRQRASVAIPLSEIRPYVVDVGNDGRLSRTGDYWTTREDLDRLFDTTIPERTKDWPKKRILLYLHGGLNAERAVAARIVAFRDVFLANQVYPLSIMWETGAFETLRSIVDDLFRIERERAGGVADWLGKFRDGLIEAKDRSFELTTAAAGRALWSEMKENARLASEAGDGGMRLLAAAAAGRLAGNRHAADFELHVVGHSAGSIFAAHAMPILTGARIPFRSLQFMAPAIRVDEFVARVLPCVAAGTCPAPTTYVMSDAGERDDTVGPYGKSLLYLVSNAFEGRRETPILGMEKFVRGPGAADAGVAKLLAANDGALPRLVVAGEAPAGEHGKDTGRVSRSQTHGGFDNDPDTMNSVLFRILGGVPAREFTVRDLQY